ncbi:MAG: hypothetical protein ACI8Z1_000940 [Candidatus Azotimanducaceae bacterium]|jgi:hypothetical protein
MLMGLFPDHRSGFVLVLTLVLSLVLFFSWGNTAYIHLKAHFAQYLIERAWGRVMFRNPGPGLIPGPSLGFVTSLYLMVPTEALLLLVRA